MIWTLRHRPSDTVAQRRIGTAAVALAAFLSIGAAPVPPVSVQVPPPVDYADPAHWICRPGSDDGTCSKGLDAVAIAPDGSRKIVPYVPAAAPPVDCFYVYPTSSLDPAPISDLKVDEERRSVHDQAARFGSGCRVFAPAYHQLTIAALKDVMARSGDPAHITLDLTVPYRDILAAWRFYLAHDNHGRGVVFIGHSQGALLLARLIAQEVERGPAANRLVAAYLAGSLTMDTGTFRRITPCRTASQTGCFVAWSTYAAGYDGPRLFGRFDPGKRPICVNPASLGGGAAMVKAYLRKPASAPASDPDYMQVTEGIRAGCKTDAAGAALRITVTPGPDAERIEAALPVSRAGPSWNFHPHDIELVQGDLIDLLAKQSAAWTRSHAPTRRR